MPIKNETMTFLEGRQRELEEELRMLEQIKKNLLAMTEKELKEEEQKTPSILENTKNCGIPIISKDGTNRINHTGQYWLKNKFNPAEGYFTSDGYRILCEYQDEGPSFVTGYDGHDSLLEFKTIKEARDYIERYKNKTTKYIIVAPDGEIVQ